MRKHKRLVLASGSPRRADLLASMGLRFEVVASNADENHAGGSWPAGVATGLAHAKAVDVLVQHPDAVVLGADTMVVRDDPDAPGGFVYYGKPTDADDAVRMLEELSGRAHGVVTGAAALWRSDSGDLCGRVEAVTTCVWFRALSSHEIAAYVATDEPMDKAGAYAIQAGAAAFVERVEGDYYNVVGLSPASVRRLLRGLVRPSGHVPPVPPAPFPIVER